MAIMVESLVVHVLASPTSGGGTHLENEGAGQDIGHEGALDFDFHYSYRHS